MFYIFNKENKCICSCDFKPNTDDLDLRKEVVVESKKIYSNIGILELNESKIIEIELQKNEIKKEENKPSIEDEIKMLKDRIEQLENQQGDI